MEQYILMSFATSHHAIGMEVEAERMGMRVRLIPTPTQISAGCGLVLRFTFEDLEKIKLLSLKKNIQYEGIFSMIKDGKNKIITPLE